LNSIPTKSIFENLQSSRAPAVELQAIWLSSMTLWNRCS